MANHASSPVLVGLGEVLWDCFEDEQHPGGAPANVAFHAQQLGCRGLVCSRVGTDSLGDELLQYLSENGLETGYVQRDDEHPTSRATVDASPAGENHFVIHEDVAWDFLEVTAGNRELLAQADAVCFGTLAQRSPVARETIRTLVGSVGENCLRIFDVNLRQHWYSAEVLENSLRLSDLVKLNDDEIRMLADALPDLPSDPTEFANRIRGEYGPRWICITRGAQGCLLLSDQEQVEVTGEAIHVVDTVGAGDAFTAGLAWARLHDWSLEQSGHFANSVGALVAGHAGAMPRLRNAFAELKETCG